MTEGMSGDENVQRALQRSVPTAGRMTSEATSGSRVQRTCVMPDRNPGAADQEVISYCTPTVPERMSRRDTRGSDRDEAAVVGVAVSRSGDRG